MQQQPQARAMSRRDTVARFTIAQNGALLDVATAILRDHKPAKVKSMLRHHQLAVNGVPTTQFNRPVQAGDVLEVNFRGSFAVFKHPRLKMVYEDDDIVVVNKPAGMLASSDGWSKGETAYSILRDYVKRYSERAHVYVVHRLEREASGLMLLARSKKVRDQLLSQWDALVSERAYEAVVEGVLERDSGTVAMWLVDDPETHLMAVPERDGQGMPPRTAWQVLQRATRDTLIEVNLKGGVKHQLRAHMAFQGHPVVGDRKYGAHGNPIGRLALHLARLSLRHPVSGTPLRFVAERPLSFQKVLN